MAEPSLSLVHLVREPAIAGSDPPPLLLMLHGIGSDEEDLFSLAPYLDGRFAIASARAPHTLAPGSYGWYRVEYGPGGLVVDEEEAKASRLALAHFIGELTKSYDVDSSRVYLMGFSQGAAMSLGLLLSRPDLIAGVVAMSGRLLPVSPKEEASGALNGIPVLVVHGTEDQVLPIDAGRAIRDYLLSLPLALTYKEYSMGHQVTPESLHDVASWLAERLDLDSG